MKKLIVNILIFGIILFMIHIVPEILTNNYYGNDCYLDKYKHFAAHKDKYNTLVWGSSRLYRHVNPKILDRQLNEYKISTYNLAASATFNPEIYYLYEKFLETVKKNELKYALIEITRLYNIENSNLNTARSFYWHNLKYLNYSIKYIFASNLSLSEKKTFIYKYIISYVYKLFNFSGYQAALLDRSAKNGNAKFIGSNKDGFYSLNDEMNDMGGNNDHRRRSTAFQENTSVLEQRIAMATKALAEKNKEQFLNPAHLSMLMNLIEKSRQKGVHLIFIIPPRLSIDDYHELLAIAEKLPGNSVIEIVNPIKYPELYQAKFSFDTTHLNKEGAAVFTEYLANELKRKCF